MGDLEDPDLPVVADAATGVSARRRWAADPLPLLLLLGAGGLLCLLLIPVSGPAWVVPALFGVTVAGVALSGST
ncbi:hypothetical protein [uncultured Serinicoccus sp.]|uniref:hypothetical protein n=1 Tax=uncultured Serinicoccus sp. TaxID=735514 RepID=UPI0026356012|nr:hypothetical protein [uncultured Serinicoccus sp.]